MSYSLCIVCSQSLVFLSGIIATLTLPVDIKPLGSMASRTKLASEPKDVQWPLDALRSSRVAANEGVRALPNTADEEIRALPNAADEEIRALPNAADEDVRMHPNVADGDFADIIVRKLRAHVQASVRSSVGSSVRSSVRSPVRSSVRSSIRSSAPRRTPKRARRDTSNDVFKSCSIPARVANNYPVDMTSRRDNELSVDLSSTALCSWRIKLDKAEGRIPRLMHTVVCDQAQCTQCGVHGTCTRVYTDVHVLRNCSLDTTTNEYFYRVVVEQKAVACVCVADQAHIIGDLNTDKGAYYTTT